MGSKNANGKNHKDKRNKFKDNLSSSYSSPSDAKVILISDPRYSKAHTDPRFREAPKRETKVAVDSRFNRMFTHKSFLPSSAPVDKRGKPKNNPTSQLGSLRHYYKIDEKEVEQSSDEEEENEEELLKANQVKPESDKGTESEETSESESEETSESESDVDTDTETDEGADEEVYEDEASDVKEDIATTDKETHRVAVVNMDWRYVKAVDLYVLLSSFVPPNGLIKSVRVYPSEFGLQRMKEEEVRGPIGLFDDEDSSNDDLDNEKLRAYEKSRMRASGVLDDDLRSTYCYSLLYYFAVVECDSSATANYIYKECDGLELKQSSNALDLRFIPDNMEFKHPPRDVATEVPANYECKDFYSRALQHSEVNLTWDDDEPLRAKTLNRKLTDEQLAEFEVKEFLTSDESESDDSKDNNETDDQPDKMAKKRAKYRALLQSGDDSDGGNEHDNAQNMEVTFNTGLEDLSKYIMEKKDKKSETVWDAYLSKKSEKKKAGKNKRKYSSDDDDSDDTDQEATEEADDFFIEEPAAKKRKKPQNKEDEEQRHEEIDGLDKASKEELELLLADDKGTDTGVKGYNLKFKKGKGKKRRENGIDEEKIPSNAYNDPLFSSGLNAQKMAIISFQPRFIRAAWYLYQRKQLGYKLNLVYCEDGLGLSQPNWFKFMVSCITTDSKRELQLSDLYCR
ncbi:hypothetical protein JHK87_003016 [Glycine soja]|nr:hypothetical protein JHK87_003016 [Glycine soja]